jgi:hypothetical protein
MHRRRSDDLLLHRHMVSEAATSAERLSLRRMIAHWSWTTWLS